MIWSISRLLSRVAYFAPGGYGLRPTLHRWRGVKLGKGIWIKHVEFRAALPKTPSGKIKKTDLL
jgi:acyl-coenzyme A synthetase/AMP-(fatty) acid ligase